MTMPIEPDVEHFRCGSFDSVHRALCFKYPGETTTWEYVDIDSWQFALKLDEDDYHRKRFMCGWYRRIINNEHGGAILTQ